MRATVTEFQFLKVHLFRSGEANRPVEDETTVGKRITDYYLRLFPAFDNTSNMLQPESNVITACRGGVLAIGNFDGVHRGHQHMAGILVSQAQTLGVPSVAMTFDPPPAALLRPDRVPPCLTTPRQRAELLSSYGVDQVIIWPTSRELLQLGPAEFFNEIIVGRLGVKGMVEGPNFCFGKNRAGDVNTLKQFCESADIALQIVVPVEAGEQLVSSSRIRKLVANGEVARAIELLGHAYQIRGEVVTGAGRGRTIGFPTANISSIPTLVPGNGVYAGFCELDGREYDCAVNVGQNPTFGEDRAKVEVHVIGWDSDLYGLQLAVNLLSEIRPVQQFESVEQLTAQIKRDIESAKHLCAQNRARQ